MIDNQMFILVFDITCIVLMLCSISVYIILYLKLRHRSCKNCKHFKGEKCCIITWEWEEINKSNQRYACNQNL